MTNTALVLWCLFMKSVPSYGGSFVLIVVNTLFGLLCANSDLITFFFYCRLFYLALAEELHVLFVLELVRECEFFWLKCCHSPFLHELQRNLKLIVRNQMLVVLMEMTRLGSHGFAICEETNFSVKWMMSTSKMISIYVDWAVKFHTMTMLLIWF